MVIAGPPIAIHVHDEPPPVALVVDRGFGILRLLTSRLPLFGIVGNDVREFACRLLTLWLPNDGGVAIFIRRYRMIRPRIVVRDDGCRWCLRRQVRRGRIDASFATNTTAATSTTFSIRWQPVRSFTGIHCCAAT